MTDLFSHQKLKEQRCDKILSLILLLLLLLLLFIYLFICLFIYLLYQVLHNPFDDIVPRQKKEEMKPKPEDQKKKKVKGTKWV